MNLFNCDERSSCNDGEKKQLGTLEKLMKGNNKQMHMRDSIMKANNTQAIKLLSMKHGHF